MSEGTSTNSHTKGAFKRILLWTAAIATVVATVCLVVARTRIGETLRREGARLLEVEYIPNQHVILDSCQAARMADSIYVDFRNNYRFHYQTIGLAAFADSSRMLLLSDIPPHFETDSLASIFAQFNHSVHTRKHRVGYDGFTTDIIILLANATNDNCDRLVSSLNRHLFLTDYKPAVTPLPAQNKRRYFASQNIDYQISLDEFNNWFIDQEEGFLDPDDTSIVLTISDLLERKAQGVFFSQLPGFVAWALHKNSDIDGQQANIRQFSLDADLILGALADSATLVIIGRERQSPLHELPPLHTETVLLLASTSEKELSQSLDINDLMAGKMGDGADWCPTFLSRELENTEFGDLLTITDVLLKDWSEHGTIRESYYRYPEPSHYPFDKPLFRKLGLNELVYNWNTAGAMYAIDRNGYTIYTLGRTGSLPVSYFNSQERSQSIGYRYESQAHNYFATIGNTDLARVVQYTALYQLFIDNNISYSGNTYPSFPSNKPFLLLKPTLSLLDTISHLANPAIALLADSIANRNFILFQKEQLDRQLQASQQEFSTTFSDEKIDQIYRNVRLDTQTGITRGIQEVKNMLNSLSDEQYRQLAKLLAYPRGVTVNSRESYNTFLQARRINRLMREIGKNNLDLFGIDLKSVRNSFAASLSANSGRYMKTSSLIVTFNDMLTTGGHNLSSRINRVNSMTNYKRGGSHAPSNHDKPATEASPKKQPVTNKTTKPSTHKSSGQASTPKKSNQSVRPRNTVISDAQRHQRGF